MNANPIREMPGADPDMRDAAIATLVAAFEDDAAVRTIYPCDFAYRRSDRRSADNLRPGRPGVLTRLVDRFRAHRARKRAHTALLELDDRLLEDIGLTHGDVADARATGQAIWRSHTFRFR